MKRFLAIFLILTLVLPTIAGCAQEDAPHVPTGDALYYEGMETAPNQDEEDPQELTLAYYADRSMNPYTCGDFTNRTLFSLIYQGLFSMDSKYNVEPILCSRYSVSGDNMSYTFYIVDNATFSDGSRLDINDVVVSLQTAKESKYYSGRFTHVLDISQTSDNGVRFTLNTPYENLPILLDVPIVKAEEVGLARPLGSGPYYFEESISGAHLRKNESWWCNIPLAVKASSIDLVKAESPAHIRDQFEFYDVGLVLADPCSDTYADYRCDYELWDCDNGIFLYIGCNAAFSEVMDDIKFRQVLTYGINRQLLVEEYYRDYAMPATLPASPSSPYYSESLAEKYKYDPMKFVDMVSQLPRPKDPLVLLVNSDDSLRLKAGRAIADMLTEGGLPTITKELPTVDYNKVFNAGTYDMYLGQTRLSPNMDLTPFYHPWGNLSFGGLSDNTLYAMCKDALENRGNYYNLHQASVEDGRVVPILFGNYAVYATRGLLTELTPARDNIFRYSLGRTMADARMAAFQPEPEDEDE